MWILLYILLLLIAVPLMVLYSISMKKVNNLPDRVINCWECGQETSGIIYESQWDPPKHSSSFCPDCHKRSGPPSPSSGPIIFPCPECGQETRGTIYRNEDSHKVYPSVKNLSPFCPDCFVRTGPITPPVISLPPACHDRCPNCKSVAKGTIYRDGCGIKKYKNECPDCHEKELRRIAEDFELELENRKYPKGATWDDASSKTMEEYIFGQKGFPRP